MPLMQPKQISKLIAGRIHTPNLVFGSVHEPQHGIYATDLLFNAALTAGDNGVPVAVRNSDDGGTPREGFIFSGRNLVEIYDGQNMKIASAGGDEVYGRLMQVFESSVLVAYQSAASDYLFTGINPNEATYATKAAVLATITSFIATYNINVPVAGRSAEQIAYAGLLTDISNYATDMSTKVAFTKAAMHANIVSYAVQRQNFATAQALAGTSVLTPLGTDPTAFANKAAVTNVVQTVINAFNVSSPIVGRDASDRATGAALATMLSIAQAAAAAAPKSVRDAFNEVNTYASAYAGLADGIFGITLWTMSGGVETSYSLEVTDDALTLKMAVPYLFTFEHLPFDFATSLKSIYVNDDPTSGNSASTRLEPITVTAQDTVNAMPFVWKPASRSTLWVNGQTVLSASSDFSINVVTNKIVWNAAQAGYSLMPNDVVYFEYETTGAAFP